MQLTPEVLWAQRSSDSDREKNYLLVTIAIPDCEDPHLELKPTYLEFKAKNKGHVGDEASHHYELHIDFFKEVVPEKSLHKIENGLSYFLKIYKKDLGSEYWPRLTKEKVKYSNIKTDFDKWVDEDDQENAPEEAGDFGDLMGGGTPDLEALKAQLGQTGGLGQGEE